MSKELQPGDRVSWMGGIDLGQREVRFVGRVIGLGFGVPSGYERKPNGEIREVFPRRTAVRVEPDLPQHGMTEIDPIAEPLIVAIDDLTPID